MDSVRALSLKIPLLSFSALLEVLPMVLWRSNNNLTFPLFRTSLSAAPWSPPWKNPPGFISARRHLTASVLLSSWSHRCSQQQRNQECPVLPGGSAWWGLQQLMQTLPFARQNCSSLGMIPEGFTYLKERQILVEFSEF